MRIIIIYNKNLDNVISKFGRQNKEIYSEETIKKIEAVLLNHNYDVRIIDGNLDMFENLRDLIKEKDRIPFVFNLAYGIQGENRYSHIPAILEMLGLPYLGSSPTGHTLALDKIISKFMMTSHGIPTPRFWEFNTMDDLNQKVRFPVILKPSMEADSQGMKIVHVREELKESLEYLFDEYNQAIFAEKYIVGRELDLGLLGNEKEIECLPLVEIDLQPDEIYTLEHKRKGKRKIIPKDLPRPTLEAMQRDAKKLFTLLRLKDYARVDIRMDADGNYYFLEINSMASLGTTGSYMAAAEAAGYTYDEMILKLLDIGVSKYFNENQKLQVRYESKYKRNRS